jgi:hypothetical protein
VIVADDRADTVEAALDERADDGTFNQGGPLPVSGTYGVAVGEIPMGQP